MTLAFFLGMSVVANIDNIMALTVTDVNIGVEMAKETIQYSRNGQESFRGDWLEIQEWRQNPEMGIFAWIAGLFILAFHRICKVFYVVAYFYFCPFMVLLLIDSLRDTQPDFE